VRKSWADRGNSGERFRPQGGDLRCTKDLANFSRGTGDIGNYFGELNRTKSAGHRASTSEGEIGRTQGAIREIGHGDGCLTSGRSSGRLGAVSGELDGQEHGRGSPAAAGSVGRARERARACEMRRGASAGHWRGSKKGVGRVGGRRGRETRQRVRVRTRWSTAGARKTDLTGRVHGAERVKGTRGATARRWRTRPTRQREGERAGEVTGADRLGPLGSESARESGRSRLRRQVWLACQAERARGRARARLNGLPWAELAFPISLKFLMPFLFPIEFSNPNSN
jgi:hypothetical protein